MPTEIIPGPDSVATLLSAGKAMGEVLTVPGGNPVVIIPHSYKLERLAVAPSRVLRTVELAEADSFAAYVNIYKTAGTVLFAHVNDDGCSIVAHLDYHDKPFLPGAALDQGWSSHTAKLHCIPTREWRTWMENNGPTKKKDQVQFALFLEDNERLFRSPSGAEMLELVSTLEGKSNVRFSSAMRLANGKAKLDYEEDVELRGSMGSVNGALEIPTELICAIAPFEGQGTYEVRSRLRYRIESRKLTFWYETITPHLIVRDAAQAVLERVAEKVKAPLLRVAG